MLEIKPRWCVLFAFRVRSLREETLATQASGGGGGGGGGGGSGGGGKTIEMWRWWYIVSLFTKQSINQSINQSMLKKKLSVGPMWDRCRVDVYKGRCSVNVGLV